MEAQAGFQWEPSIVTLANGSYVTAWTDNNTQIANGNTDPHGLGGQTVMWLMDSNQKVADLGLSSIPLSFHVQGVGDFNGDANADILWRNDSGTVVLWRMNGGTKLADLDVATISNAFQIQALGDLNSDGRSDILWRRDSGQTVLWEMNGSAKIGDLDLSTISTDFTIQHHVFDIV